MIVYSLAISYLNTDIADPLLSRIHITLQDFGLSILLIDRPVELSSILDTICCQRFSLGLSSMEDTPEPVGCYLPPTMIDLFIGTESWISKQRDNFEEHRRGQSVLSRINAPVQAEFKVESEFNSYTISDGELRRYQEECQDLDSFDDSASGLDSKWSSGFSTSSDSDFELGYDPILDTSSYEEEEESETPLYLEARNRNNNIHSISSWVLSESGSGSDEAKSESDDESP